MIYTEARAERAFLVGLELKRRHSLWRIEDSLAELAQLAQTAGVVVVGQTIQRLDHPNPATYIGKGKVEEIELEKRELDFDVVIFDDELSPAQQRNLENKLDIKVIDRTALILDIFAQHAHTREGSLQVELAQYEYRLPRLTRLWTHLARQAGGAAGRGGTGGVGLRGPGETQLESDRREIMRIIARIKRELEDVRTHRQLYRQHRKRAGIPIVAIVGYTNAGKSTLLNALTSPPDSGGRRGGVLVEDKLFATLDPTTRRVVLPEGKEVLFTDTVGFIQKLPTQLIAAFRATLEEINEADLLLHVVDITNPNAEEQWQSVEEILADLGVGDKPAIIALNKIDRLEKVGEETPYGLRITSTGHTGDERLWDFVAAHPDSVPISAEQGMGLPVLLAKVEEKLVGSLSRIRVRIPYQNGDVVAMIHQQGIVEREEHTPDGTIIEGRVPRRMVAGLREYVH